MTFGIVGLGGMGLSLGQMAVERGHEVVAWDPDASTRDTASQAGLHTVDELTDVPGDVVADCGNSFWEESQARHDRIAESGVHFLDIGTSGGISDAPGWNGAAFMVGGPL